jgi:aryl-alcohol dehydrogenase-like predicted oxidoreductase
MRAGCKENRPQGEAADHADPVRPGYGHQSLEPGRGAAALPAQIGGVPGAQVALAWAARRPGVPAMFVGGSTPHCLAGAAAALMHPALDRRFR